MGASECFCCINWHLENGLTVYFSWLACCHGCCFSAAKISVVTSEDINAARSDYFLNDYLAVGSV